MPTDIEILHQMIVDEAKLELQVDPYGKSNVQLTESQSPNSSITISNLPDEIIVINLDSFWSLDTMFEHERGQCKRADFVIIADDDRRVIIYIEMKKNKAPEHHIVQQLTGAHCFVTFCQKIGQAQAFWNQSDFLNDFEHRFVSISHTSIPKKPTRIQPRSGIHDRPERLLKLSSPAYLTVKRLIEN